MTVYEALLIKAECCLNMAKAYRILGEKDLVKFYDNAHKGFIAKAKKLTYKEATQLAD